MFQPHTDITGEYDPSLEKDKVCTSKQEITTSATEQIKLNLSKNVKASSLNFKPPKV